MDGCLLNRERKGLKISVRSMLTGLEIKTRLDEAAAAGDLVYIPGEMTKEPEGYSLYVRNRTSVKEYLSEAEPDPELITILLEGLCQLWHFCGEHRLPFYRFLFDYDAVFISGVMERVEFLYLPGAPISAHNNSLTEFLTILSLHAEGQEEEGCAGMLRRAAAETERWERESGAFPEAALRALIAPPRAAWRQWFTDRSAWFRERIRSKQIRGKQIRGRQEAEKKPARPNGGRWRRFLLLNLLLFCLAALLLAFVRTPLIWPIWLAASLAGEWWALPGKRGRPGVKWVLSLSGASVPGKEEVTVGRDAVWADLSINDARVSRRHAVIFQKKRSLTVRDLFSSNGTFVDGRRIAAGEEVAVRSGQVISFGADARYSVKFRPRILFSDMVK